MSSSSFKKKFKSSQRERVLSPRKQRVFALITAVLPLILLLVLEIALRLAHYGKEYELVSTTTVGGKECFTINPSVGMRYFNPHHYFVPLLAADNFDVLKSNSTIRVFVIGESTTAGFPYEYNSTPSNILKKHLEIAFPDKKFEIINASLTATNSYTVLEFIEELVKYQPDIFLIYSGQNEFYGALGVGSTISFGHERWLVRTYQHFRKLRTFVLLEHTILNISDWIFGSGTREHSGTLMAQIAKDKTIPFQGDLYRKAINAYEQNLQSSVEIATKNNIPVVLSTLVTNERGLPPFVSLYRSTVTESQKKDLTVLLHAGEEKQVKNDYFGAIECYRNILSIDSMWAMAHYKLGECYDRVGNPDSAWIEYDKARDFDGLRFRASSENNQIIRQIGKSSHVVLADVESTFRANSPNGIIGNELLWEHVHPNLKGYLLLERSWFDAVRKSMPLLSSDTNKFYQSISDSILLERVKITPLDVEIGAMTMSQLLHQWPFPEKKEAAQPIPSNSVQRVAEMFIKGKLRWSEAHYEMADAFLRENNIAGAVNEYESVHTMYPDALFPLIPLGDLYSTLHENQKAMQAYLNFLSNSESQVVRLKLGVLYLKAGKMEAALEHLSIALKSEAFSQRQLSREQFEDARFFLSVALWKTGKRGEAIQSLKSILQFNPNDNRATRLLAEIQNSK